MCNVNSPHPIQFKTCIRVLVIVYRLQSPVLLLNVIELNFISYPFNSMYSVQEYVVLPKFWWYFVHTNSTAEQQLKRIWLPNWCEIGWCANFMFSFSVCLLATFRCFAQRSEWCSRNKTISSSLRARFVKFFFATWNHCSRIQWIRFCLRRANQSTCYYIKDGKICIISIKLFVQF